MAKQKGRRNQVRAGWRKAKDLFMHGFEIDGVFEYEPTLADVAEKTGLSVDYLRNVSSPSGGGKKDRPGSSKQGWYKERRRHHEELGIVPEEERCKALVQQAKINRDMMLRKQLKRLTRMEERYDESVEAGKNEITNRDILAAMHQKRQVMNEIVNQHTTPLEQHSKNLLNLGILIQTKGDVENVEVIDAESRPREVVPIPPVSAPHRSK